MEDLIKAEIETLRKNKITRKFVEDQAYAKIAEDIRERNPGSVCTPKAAELIVANRTRNPDIHARWNHYVAAGYAGVIMAKYKTA